MWPHTLKKSSKARCLLTQRIFHASSRLALWKKTQLLSPAKSQCTATERILWIGSLTWDLLHSVLCGAPFALWQRHTVEHSVTVHPLDWFSEMTGERPQLLFPPLPAVETQCKRYQWTNAIQNWNKRDKNAKIRRVKMQKMQTSSPGPFGGDTN